MGVSKNSATPKSSSLICFSIINHPFWGRFPPIFGNTHIHQCLARYFRSKRQQYQLGTCEFRPPMWRWEYFTASTILTVKRRQCEDAKWHANNICSTYLIHLMVIKFVNAHIQAGKHVWKCYKYWHQNDDSWIPDGMFNTSQVLHI